MSISPEQCSVHTHSDLCDGRDPLEAMAAAALDAGVRYFGASGHSHPPSLMMRAMCCRRT